MYEGIIEKRVRQYHIKKVLTPLAKIGIQFLQTLIMVGYLNCNPKSAKSTLVNWFNLFNEDRPSNVLVPVLYNYLIDLIQIFVLFLLSASFFETCNSGRKT